MSVWAVISLYLHIRHHTTEFHRSYLQMWHHTTEFHWWSIGAVISSWPHILVPGIATWLAPPKVCRVLVTSKALQSEVSSGENVSVQRYGIRKIQIWPPSMSFDQHQPDQDCLTPGSAMATWSLFSASERLLSCRHILQAAFIVR